RFLASGSGYEDPAIRVWDAATGRFLARLDGHSSWVGKLVFTRDGRGLISAASDQSIRFWDTSTWTETKVLRGHTDEVHAVAISDSAQLVASTGKDGNLMSWKEDGKSAADGYRRLPENLHENAVLPLDHSRVLLLPPGKPPVLLDLKRDSPPGVATGDRLLSRCPGLVWHQRSLPLERTQPNPRQRVARCGVYPARSHRAGIRPA